MNPLVRQRVAWLFVLPALGVFLLVAAFPLAQVVFLSFTQATLAATEPLRFVGLANYVDLLFHDPDFHQALVTTLVFAGVSVALETLLGLAIALLLNQRFPGRGWVRALVLLPWAIPTVVSAQMWRWMLHDIYGVINLLGVSLGVLPHKVAWLSQPATALPTLILVDVWKTTPFMVLLLLAGLQVIPQELYESAAMDGAGAWQRFRHITLPLLLPILVVAVIFRTVDALRVFDLVYVMTAGGSRTETLAVYARRVIIDFQELGYGSALSVVILALILAFAVLYARQMREEGLA